MPVRVLIDNHKKLRGSTLITGFHGVGQTGYLATSYLIHALSAERIGFVEVSNPPPWIGTADGGLVTPFEVYQHGKTVMVKLEFSPHKSEESEFAKVLADWAVEQKFKDAVLIGGLDSSYKRSRHGFCIVPTGAYSNGASFKGEILEPGLLVYGPLAVMLGEFEIHNFPAVAVLPFAEPSHADPAAAALALRRISKAYGFKIQVDELVKDAKFVEKDFNQKNRMTSKSLQRMYA